MQSLPYIRAFCNAAAFLLSEAVVPEMPDGDSCIINISSTRAKQSEPWSEV